MSCFNPNLLLCTKEGSVINHHFLGPYSCYRVDIDDFGYYGSLVDRDQFYMTVPCRHCLGCRIDRSREWRNRMLFEFADSKTAIFCTLTYDNEHLPLLSGVDPESGPYIESTLDVRDTQSFLKRLRARFPDKRIRFYLCGEYGPRTFRPHYHAILFGLSLSDFPDAYVQQYNELGQPSFVSPLFERLWRCGHAQISGCTSRTISYVARYVMKKHYKSIDKSFFAHGRKPEFSNSSRNPGIGFLNAEQYVMSGLSQFSFTFPDQAMTLPLPSSFIDHCRRNESVDIDVLTSLIYDRCQRRYHSLRDSLHFLELVYTDYLDIQQRKLCDRLKILPERSDF